VRQRASVRSAFGLVPAWQTTRLQLVSALKEESGAVVSTGHVRWRKGLVVAQVALSLLLLVGAGQDVLPAAP
jgi:hypothetical protein